jgi:hypothetical protein
MTSKDGAAITTALRPDALGTTHDVHCMDTKIRILKMPAFVLAVKLCGEAVARPKWAAYERRE